MAATLSINTPTAPPTWALLQRQLIAAESQACEEFYARFFDGRGYLKCLPRWGGNDGPDDAIENCTGWPILHAIGGCDSVLEMAKQAWEGHILQYTEARTVDVPFAREGMYYKEFSVMFDFFHHQEGLVVLNLQGFSDPYDDRMQKRLRRFSGFYMDEDPQAKNYDPERRIIRSMFTGSRGPLLRKATALDWAGDPIDVDNFPDPKHGERNWDEMLAHFEEYTDVVGDHPLNLQATSLAANAYACTGDEKYRDWLIEYVDAWCERTAANDGIIPSNIGLDGTIGGECDGKWYGGCYGWGFTVTVPQTGAKANRNIVSRAVIGFGNALLVTGQQKYIDVWRNMLATINANAKEVDGQTVYPSMYGDDGWYAYGPHPYSAGALQTYLWSMDPNDRALADNAWIRYLEGDNPDYPVAALENALEQLRGRVEGMRAENATDDTRLSDDTLQFNPAVINSLVELMLGGHTPSFGETLHVRLRYFDPDRGRAGIPEDVAALIEGLTDDEVVVNLVNTSPVNPRTLIVQAGAYAEHQFTSVTSDAGDEIAIDESSFRVKLAPGAGAKLTIKMQRYQNPPTFSFPWDR